eukprot:CAMPEP_0184319702 /NCGR_PEP_ID=MMETSP1049-20130417/110037_1 /TAXON_ID=77928 /ORGANISM="Proteomonas sulcata, Strain CCMP704" /LENGTH=69 /DNA_ID=CAMNT_0026639953 /DNA_START=904 /DNA_END=1114 /DNA_ORIENTATION=-
MSRQAIEMATPLLHVCDPRTLKPWDLDPQLHHSSPDKAPAPQLPEPSSSQPSPEAPAPRSVSSGPRGAP